MKHVAAYCRVSTYQQNTELQENEIQRWLENKGIPTQKVKWYIDKESGKHLKRPKFEQLQKEIFKGNVNKIVVWKLDRLSRSIKDGVSVLADWCEQGIEVVSVTQQIELAGAMGRMVAALLLGVAEMELELRRERQAAGIKAAKAKGTYTGRKKGSQKGNPARARDLKERGLKTSEIAQALGISERTVRRYVNA